MFVQNSLWRNLTGEMIAEMPPKLPKVAPNSEVKTVNKNPAADPLGEVGHDLDPAKFVTFPDSPYQLYQPFAPAGDQPQAIDALVEGIEDGLTFQTLLGVTGSGKTFTMANVIARTGRPAIIFAPNKTLAAQLYSEFREFFPKNAVEYFVSYYDYYQPEAYVPQRDLFIEKDSSINEHIEQMRLSATKSLLERRDVIIVATVSAIYGIGNPGDYHSMVMTLRPGDKMSQRDILMRLIAMQYDRNELDFKRGVFRVRGDTIDIFPAEHNELAVRVELFDDVIESLQFFDPLTGKIRQKIPRFTVYPSSHYVTPRDTVLKAIETIKTELRTRLDEFVKDGKLVEAQRLEQRTRFDLEMLNELGFCKGIENYSRHLSGAAPGEAPPTLVDYLPNDALMFLDESHVLIGQLNAMYNGDKSRKHTLVEFGFRLPSAMDNRPLKFTEFETKMRQTIFVSATPADYENTHQGQVVEQVARPTGLVDPEIEVLPASTQVDDLLDQIHERVKVGERILVTVLTKRMAEQLTDYLSDNGVKVRYVHSDIDTVERVEILRDLRLGVFDVLVGINLLREGLDIPEVSLVAILDADKEGFLRSERSLIQTIGRAARNVRGKAILYADKITDSMRRAMGETERRRTKQIAFNKLHGIEPKGVQKRIKDIIDGVYDVKEKRQEMQVEQERARYEDMGEKDLASEIKRLEKQMNAEAKNLEFEKAASTRDRLTKVKEMAFGARSRDSVWGLHLNSWLLRGIFGIIPEQIARDYVKVEWNGRVLPARLWAVHNNPLPRWHMRLTTKGRFAVTAMIDLALRETHGPVTLAGISQRQKISLSYLEQLFGKLRRFNIVESTRGPGGGYTLARPSSEVSVADIIVAVDEPLDATQCGGKGNCHSDEENHGRCMTHDLWSNLNSKMVEYLSSVSLKDLVQQQEGRGVVIQDMRQKKIKVESAKADKPTPALAAKKDVAPKLPLVNSVFNLARQS